MPAVLYICVFDVGLKIIGELILKTFLLAVHTNES